MPAPQTGSPMTYMLNGKQYSSARHRRRQLQCRTGRVQTSVAPFGFCFPSGCCWCCSRRPTRSGTLRLLRRHQRQRRAPVKPCRCSRRPAPTRPSRCPTSSSTVSRRLERSGKLESGAYWHCHTGGQLLMLYDGVGRVQQRGQRARVLHKGDTEYAGSGRRALARRGTGRERALLSDRDRHEHDVVDGGSRAATTTWATTPASTRATSLSVPASERRTSTRRHEIS